MGMFAARRGGLQGRIDGEGILGDQDVGILLVAILQQPDSGAGEFGDELPQACPAGLKIGRGGRKDAGKVEDGIERGKWASTQIPGPRQPSPAVYDGVGEQRCISAIRRPCEREPFFSGERSAAA